MILNTELVTTDLFKSLTEDKFGKVLLLSGENMYSLLTTMVKSPGLKLVTILEVL